MPSDIAYSQTNASQARRTLFIGVASVLIATVPAFAQSPEPSNIPVSDPYVRYTRPGQCTQAAIRLNALYWRDKRPDTVVYAPTAERVPASVVRAARACALRFDVERVPVRDLLSLLQLYLWTGQDDLAQVAATRLLEAESQHPALERGWTLYLLASAYLNIRPARIEMATHYLARLDSMGAAVAAWQLLAHTAFSTYAMSVNDVPGAFAHARAALASSTRMSKNDRIDRVFAILDGYSTLVEPTAIRAGGHAALAVFDSAAADLLPLRAPGTNGTLIRRDAPSGSPQMVQTGRGRMTMLSGLRDDGGAYAQTILKSNIEDMRRPYTVLGETGPPLRALHWYNTGRDTTRRPVPGTVSLLVSVNSNCGGVCYSMYATVRRLYNKYHAAGLQVVFMAHTSGFFRNQPVPGPSTESEKIRAYLLDFLKLPGVVGVSETDFSHRTDGFRLNTPTESQQDYFRGVNGVVVGKDGTVRMVVGLAPEREHAIAAVLASELSK